MEKSRVSHQDEVELDLKALLGSMYKAKWKLAATSILVGAVTGFLVMSQETNYSADARLLIAPQDAGFARSSVENPVSASSADEAMFASQVQILTSRDLASRVIDELNIIDEAELNEGSLAAGITAMLGLGGGGKNARDRAIENFAKRLTVEAVDQTRVITVQYKSLKQGLSAKVVNAVVADYQQLQRNAKVENTKDATRLLETEISKLRERVKEAESKVESYRAGSDLLQVTGEGTDTLVDQRLSDANAQLTRVRAEKTEAQARARRVRSLLKEGISAESAAEVSSNPLIQRLKEQLLAQQGEIAELSATLLPAHPSIRALKTQVVQTKNSIRAEVRNILQGLENDARIAAAREKGLLQDLNRLKLDVAGANEQSIKLRALEREAAAQRQLLESFLARYREALSLQNPEFVLPDARIIARATVPSEPVKKNVVAKAIVGALGAFLIGIVLVVLRSFFTGEAFRTVSYQAELPRDAAVGPLQSAPAYLAAGLDAEKTDHPQAAGNWSPDADVTRMAPDSQHEANQDVVSIAAKAALETLKKGQARIVMLAPGQTEEQPLTSKPIARTISKAGKNVVLISLSDAKLAGRADIAWEGLSDLIDGEASYSQILYRDRLSRCHLVPSGSRQLTADDFRSESFQTLLAALGETYDIVLVDTGSFGENDHVVEGLTKGAEALALVLTAQESDESASEIGHYLKSIGFADVAIVITGEDGIDARDVA
ncbi:MAG: exopolysaccharide transport family protein [Cohaesibacter sp.]|jgi:uncharacterized protein involved in exopolysaccharide biosynthesis|nr:exopolysaccharide transport family protein [Cohaesibacter sp.]